MKMIMFFFGFVCVAQFSRSEPLLAPRSGIDRREEESAIYDFVIKDIGSDFIPNKSLGAFIMYNANRWMAFYICLNQNKKESIVFICKGIGLGYPPGQLIRRSLDIDPLPANHLYDLFLFHISNAANSPWKISVLDYGQIEYWIKEEGVVRSGISCSPENNPPALDRVLCAVIDLMNGDDSEQSRRMAELETSIKAGLRSIGQHLPANRNKRGPR